MKKESGRVTVKGGLEGARGKHDESTRVHEPLGAWLKGERNISPVSRAGSRHNLVPRSGNKNGEKESDSTPPPEKQITEK